ncbi:MAG: hypothetical protein OEV36_09410 [Myxococcales bacterium]|nr:hypothetical protein [Myxococcales bacterium]
MPHPDEDPELPAKTRRRPSHFRKKRKDTTTKLVRVARVRESEQLDDNHVVHSRRVRHVPWSEVVNPAPALPDPLLYRPMPPPAPLPSETSADDPTVPSWLGNRERRKRVEDVVGTLVLAILVGAMLAAMWLTMTKP